MMTAGPLDIHGTNITLRLLNKAYFFAKRRMPMITQSLQRHYGFNRIALVSVVLIAKPTPSTIPLNVHLFYSSFRLLIKLYRQQATEQHQYFLLLISFNYLYPHFKKVYCQIQFINVQMSQIVHFSDHFQSRKHQILKQKYQYLTFCLSQTERRVSSLKATNKILRNQYENLQSQTYNNQTEHLQIQNCLKRYREEEKQKLKKIEQLKKLISQYKYLCQQAMKCKSNTFNSKSTLKQTPIQYDSLRENSFLNMDYSENQNRNNVSTSRNKSYQKIKTKVYCEKCETQYKPNEYYRHFQQCQGVPLNQSSLSSISTTKIAKSSKLIGYKTMRN